MVDFLRGGGRRKAHLETERRLPLRIFHGERAHQAQAAAGGQQEDGQCPPRRFRRRGTAQQVERELDPQFIRRDAGGRSTVGLEGGGKIVGSAFREGPRGLAQEFGEGAPVGPVPRVATTSRRESRACNRE